jgi:16S rRNA (guanine1207-N2)-methyltransferase
LCRVTEHLDQGYHRLDHLDAALLASDGLAELTGTFDWIISNPPFHKGVSNDLDIASRFFREAGTFLANRGNIVIVCNRHLPYAGWLRNHFEQVELLDENEGFAVIQASSPRKG